MPLRPMADTSVVRPRSLWHGWLEPWYAAYALLGATVDGIVPILVPLAVSERGTAVHVGLVMAAIRLGGVTAPLWGGLADLFRLHRVFLVGGLVLSTAGLAALSFTTAPTLWLLLGLLLGVGVSGTATVASLLVVEVHPRSEWGPRLGWLQTFYAGGQVGGLLLAAALSATHPRGGLLVAAGLTALAGLLGWRTVRPSSDARPSTSLPDPNQPAHRERRAEGLPLPRRRPGVQARLAGRFRHPFTVFLALWLIAFTGSGAVFSLYPLLMQHVFGVSPGRAAWVYAVAAGLGLALYPRAGRWCEDATPAKVLQAGLGIRLLACSGLLAVGLTAIAGRGWLALLAFAVIVLSWSLLSVSGSGLAARFSSMGEGQGMGVFTAVTAMANALGAGLGGWAAGQWGYNAAATLAVIGTAGGLSVTGVLWRTSWKSGIRQIRERLFGRE